MQDVADDGELGPVGVVGGDEVSCANFFLVEVEADRKATVMCHAVAAELEFPAIRR
jgi:hypothetical protein